MNKTCLWIIHPSSLIPHPSLPEVLESSLNLLNRLRHPVEPVIVPGVDCHTSGGADAQRIGRRQLGGDPDLEALGEPDPVLRLPDGGPGAGRRAPSPIPTPANGLHNARNNPSGSGIESAAAALP